MRWMLALLIMLPLPVFSAEQHYVNVRYGYAIDVPSSLIGQGESENGDGQLFKSATASLAVFGGSSMDSDFETEVKARQGYSTEDGWNLTYQVSTPRYASYSAVRTSQILYVRMIALCGGSQFAEFELEYSKADLKAFNPIIDGLVASLKATDGSAMCN